MELLWPALAILVSLALMGPLLAISDVSPLDGYSSLLDASFGSTVGFSFLLLTSVPLVIIGLGVALPYRAGLFNIGGEGQLLVGALVAVLFATEVQGLGDYPLSFLLPLAVALPAGAALGAIAGALKAWRGVNEIVTTIMLSFLAILVVQYLVREPFAPPGAVFPATESVPPEYRMTAIGPNEILPVGFIVAVVAAVAVWMLAEFTRTGWRQRLVALNPALAARQNIRVGWEQLLALTLGGAIVALGGAAEALGNQYRVGVEFSPGWGFIAVAIALLARGNALAVLPIGLFFGFLQNGVDSLRTDLDVSSDLVVIVGAAPVLIVAGVVGYRAYRRAIATAPDD